MSEHFRHCLNNLSNGNNVSFDDMSSLMHELMTGGLTQAQIASILIAMKIKGESIDEITGAASVMRDCSNKVKIEDNKHLVDTCGTGGDSLQTFNVSTMSAIIAAAAGVKVAKHGGRSVSSKCGSADVLEALGVNVNLNHLQIATIVNKIGIGFMFAPNYHPAMKYVAPIRKDLGVRTIFNLLGPLTNPASAKQQILGVYQRSLTKVLARVLENLGSTHVMVVNGEDGMDEISITGRTFVAELKNNEVKEYVIDPKDYGLPLGKLVDIKVENVAHSKAMMLDILNGKSSTARNISLLNAGAAIYVSGLVVDIEAGIEKAIKVINSGEALLKLKELVTLSND
jgi:anthranilate phosphoribosyltransferase